MLVLGETAVSSEEKTSLCLDRLAGVERRIGSIPAVRAFDAGLVTYNKTRFAKKIEVVLFQNDEKRSGY